MRRGIQGAVHLSSLLCSFDLRAVELGAYVRGMVTNPSAAWVPAAKAAAAGVSASRLQVLTPFMDEGR